MEKSRLNSKDPFSGILGDRKDKLLGVFQACQDNVDFCQEFIRSPESAIRKLKFDDGTAFPPIYKNIHPGTLDWMRRTARKYAVRCNSGLNSKLFSTRNNSSGLHLGNYFDAGECEHLALALGMDVAVLRHVEESDSPTDAAEASRATGIAEDICDAALELIAKEGFIKKTDSGYSFVVKPESYLSDLPSEEDILALAKEDRE